MITKSRCLKYFILFISLVSLVSCGQQHVSQLTVALKYQDMDVNCQSVIEVNQKQWQLAQFHIYLSNFQYLNKQGQWHNWPLATEEEQLNDIVLIGSDCGKSDVNLNWPIHFAKQVKRSQISKVRFSVGVPFAQNHLNPLLQSHPLNVPNMFWVWRTGHKFARIEMKGEQDYWLFHLGSTGCRSVSPVRAPTERCTAPNTVEVELVITNSQVISFDLAKLLSGTVLNSENSCQSEPDNKACEPLFINLGVNSNNSVFGVLGE